MQLNYDDMKPALIGQLYDVTDANDVCSYGCDYPATAQVSRLAVGGTWASGQVYTCTIDGITVSYTTVTGDTNNSGAATGLAAAINAEPLLFGRLSAAASSANVDITARYAGLSFTITADSATGTGTLTASSVTSNDQADVVPFGIAMIRKPSSDDYVVLLSSAILTAPVYTLTPTAVNAAVYTVLIEINDQFYQGSYTADGSATVAEITAGLVSAINTAMPASTVLAEDSTTHVTLTGEVDGVDFTVSSIGGGVLTIAQTTGGASDAEASVARVFAGVSVRTAAVSATAFPPTSIISETEVAGYPTPGVINVIRHGRIVVAPEDAASFTSLVGRDVYVRLATSGTNVAGQFRASAASGFIRLPRSQARWSRILSGGLAVLQLSTEN